MYSSFRNLSLNYSTKYWCKGSFRSSVKLMSYAWSPTMNLNAQISTLLKDLKHKYSSRVRKE